MSAPFQPAIVSYAKDSCVIVEGKTNSDRFFIVQKGKVQIKRDVDSLMGQDANVSGPGDIIAVVSAMASYSYIETVVAVTDVTLLVVERKQYGDLIRSNTSIAIRIIQQFSQRLRKLHEALSSNTPGSDPSGDPSLLIKLGDFYAGQRRYDAAFYGYQQYLRYCPDSPLVQELKEKMKKIAPHVKIVNPAYSPDQMERKYPAGCVIFAEGESGQELFIISDGSVKISKLVNDQEVVLSMLKKGDIFGEMALLEDRGRAATAAAYEDCKLLAVNKANFEELIRTNPDMVARLTTMMAERIWLMYKQLANTLIEDPLGRMYDSLLIQLEKARVGLKTNQSHLCNFGFQELAGMAGIAPNESDALIKKILLSKRILLSNGKIYVTDASEVLRQTEYYKRAQRIGIGGR